jgi:hypothetical protein
MLPVKRALGLEHAVGQNQVTAHDGSDDLLAVLARRTQPISKILENGSAADRCDGRHIKHAPQMGVASLLIATKPIPTFPNETHAGKAQ